MKEKIRFVFVDLLRGWALLVMIEVHVFNTMLLPSLKTTHWFAALNFINGLVAPSFLFISGFAFMLSTRKDTVGEMRKFGFVFWRKLGRIALIFLAGYSLHLPILSLRRLINYYSPDVILRIYNVDILQCIAAGLLILFILRIIIRSDRIFTIINVSIFLITVFLAPLVWKIDFGKFMPVPLAAFFNHRYGSLFPLFPWLGFLFAGAVACDYFLRLRNQSRERIYINLVFAAGIVFAAAGTFIPAEIFYPFGGGFKPQPAFFFERLGYVLMLLSACWYYVKIRNTQHSFVLKIGRESLLIYWLHLQIIYRKFWGDISLADILGRKIGPAECILITVIIAWAMVIVANYWEIIKNKNRPLMSKLTFAFISLLILIFLAGF